MHVQQRAARDNGGLPFLLTGAHTAHSAEKLGEDLPTDALHCLAPTGSSLQHSFRVLFLVIAVIFLVTWSILPCKGKVNRTWFLIFHAVHFRSESGSPVIRAGQHRCRLLRQDDAKPRSKEQAAMPSHHTPKDRSSFRVSGLAVSAVYSPLAFVSSMCTYSAQASQSRAAALSFGIRLLARPTPRHPALRNSGMFSGVTPPMAT